jgi:hypothetical protein
VHPRCQFLNLIKQNLVDDSGRHEPIKFVAPASKSQLGSNRPPVIGRASCDFSASFANAFDLLIHL